MKPGDVVGGRFALEAVAGRGAMGVVFRARDLTNEQRVAVKFIRGGPTAVARFAREIEIVARLHHPRVVRYVAHGASADGQAFLAMEWLEGETLQDRLERAPLTLVETIDIARAVAEALVAAHALGGVHRDLKPANIFLVGNTPDAVKVVDFGVARAASEGPALTASGEIVGTPAYMSPEQALGKKDLDGRSDFFSLGSILYRCISGSHPFGADTAMRVLLRLTSERAAPIVQAAPGTPAKLASVIDSMLAPDPRERPESAASVHGMLSQIRAELAPTVGSIPGVARTEPLAAHPTLPFRVPRPRKAFGQRLGAVYLTVFALGTLALVALGAVWAFTLGPLASSNPLASQKIAGGKDGCPAKALACVASRIRDPSHVDPLELAPLAAAFGKSQGAGDITMIKTDGLTADGVDLTSNATIAYHMAGGLRVEAHGGLLVAFSGSGRTKGSPLAWGTCGVKEAYRAAAAAGIATSRPWTMTLWDKAAESGAGYFFVGPAPDGASDILLTVAVSDCKRAPAVILPAL